MAPTMKLFTTSKGAVSASVSIQVSLEVEGGHWEDPRTSYTLQLPEMNLSLIEGVVDLKKLPAMAIEAALKELAVQVENHNTMVKHLQAADLGNDEIEAAFKIINNRRYNDWPEDENFDIGNPNWELRLFTTEAKEKKAELVPWGTTAENNVPVPLTGRF